MKGKSDFDLFGPAHARRAFQDEQTINPHRQPLLDIEERVVWPDGSVSWVSASKLPLRDHAGKIIGTFGISRDITARKEDQERLREQAEIINQAPIAIFISDLENRITYCNEGAAQIYGLRREDIVGHVAEELLDEESAERLQAARILTQGKGSWTGVLPMRTRTGPVDPGRAAPVADRRRRGRAAGAPVHCDRRDGKKEIRGAVPARAAAGKPRPARGGHRARPQQRPRARPDGRAAAAGRRHQALGAADARGDREQRRPGRGARAPDPDVCPGRGRRHDARAAPGACCRTWRAWSARLFPRRSGSRRTFRTTSGPCGAIPPSCTR
ncbi:MAG: PAS domain S-box protein [Lacunisphaera sp.]